MKFVLSSVETAFYQDEHLPYEKYGFVFEEDKSYLGGVYHLLMNNDVEVELNSLEDFLKLRDDLGRPIIVYGRSKGKYELTIYNGFIE